MAHDEGAAAPRGEETAPEEVRRWLVRLLQAELPALDIESIELLGSGLDNVVHRVNDELLVRVGTDPDRVARAERVTREASLLRLVTDICPVPVPRPVLVDPEAGCLGYYELPGEPLLGIPLPERRLLAVAVAGTLGQVLHALHVTPVEHVEALVELDETPPGEWVAEAAETYADVAAALPVEWRTPVERFLGQPPPRPAERIVFSHNDLGIEHVLVDRDTAQVTGLIDWSDAAVVDAACDFGRIHRDLGPDALTAALDAYALVSGEERDALVQRAVFYARCGVLEDLAFGLEHDRDAYVHKSLDALGWLFDPDPV